jgi:hypothetical protein
MTQQLNQGDLFRESGGFCEVAAREPGRGEIATSLKMLWGERRGYGTVGAGRTHGWRVPHAKAE